MTACAFVTRSICAFITLFCVFSSVITCGSRLRKLPHYMLHAILLIIKVRFSILVTERWARSWSRCTGSQPISDFPPGVQSLCQPKNVTVLRPVPCYTAWWQRHIGVNNLPKVVKELCPGGNWPTTYWSQVQRLTATPLHHFLQYCQRHDKTMCVCCSKWHRDRQI